jgi:hypothetical protein
VVPPCQRNFKLGTTETYLESGRLPVLPLAGEVLLPPEIGAPRVPDEILERARNLPAHAHVGGVQIVAAAIRAPCKL